MAGASRRGSTRRGLRDAMMHEVGFTAGYVGDVVSFTRSVTREGKLLCDSSRGEGALQRARRRVRSRGK